MTACRGCVVSKCAIVSLKCAIVYLKCANVRRGRPGARAMRRCVCTPRGTTARPGAQLHAAEGREAGAGGAEGMCRGARGWRWPCGGDVQRGARLALATRRGCAEGREAGAGQVEGLRRGVRGLALATHRDRFNSSTSAALAARRGGGDAQRGARLALATRRGGADGREAGAGHAEGLRGGERGWRWPGGPQPSRSPRGPRHSAASRLGRSPLRGRRASTMARTQFQWWPACASAMAQ